MRRVPWGDLVEIGEMTDSTIGSVDRTTLSYGIGLTKAEGFSPDTSGMEVRIGCSSKSDCAAVIADNC